MKERNFKSVFSVELNNYLDHKIAEGYKECTYLATLRSFDRYCQDSQISLLEFSKSDYERWVQRREGEATTSQYRRVNIIRHFLTYMFHKGYPVYVGRDVRYKPTDFQPHIYSMEEIQRYFEAVDNYESLKNHKNVIQLPVLFRTLYCCGTRISETLSIRKKDVDLRNGILKLNETKNSQHRLIPLNDEMLELYSRYADKCFYLLKDDDYIFTSSAGTRLDVKQVHNLHVEFLRRAGIPFLGEHRGPRVHDWRHTFAVNSFKKLIDEGRDMYSALPIVSTYLGHKTIYATERYVRLVCEHFPEIEKRFNRQLDIIFGEAGVYEE